MASSSPPRSDEDYHINFLTNALAGVMAAPVCLVIFHKLPETWIPITLFAGAAVSSFIQSVLKNEGWCRSILDALVASVSFIAGGIIPMIIGMVVENRKVRIAVLVELTVFITALLLLNWITRMFVGGGDRRTTQVHLFFVWFLVMASISTFVTVADRVK